MKILKIVLKNFIAFKKTLNTNEITIDFNESKNNICLIIGPNGSGKTSLLSMLHPFSDVGNLDVRNNINLIEEGKDGYKEIHIKKNNDIYVIKHFYTHHKDKNHSLKSYIEKNGVELNINGNVTSFKEYVREELQIETDYLKLIRIGTNVTSLINLSATERKNFMSKIMDDIGIFLEYYKSVNTKLRQLNEMISHAVDKENRLNIIDKKEYKKEIKELEKEIERYESDFIKENNRLTILSNTIDTIEDNENLISNLHKTEKLYEKMINILNKKDDLQSKDPAFYDRLLEELNDIVTNDTNKIESNKLLIQSSLDNLNILQEHLRTYSIQLDSKLNSDKEFMKMNDNIKEKRKRLREYESIVGEFKTKISGKDMNDFISFLNNIQSILFRMYEFGKPPISKVVSLMRTNKDVINYINSHIIDLDEKKSHENSVFLSLIASKMVKGEDIVFNCKDECVAKDLFIQLKNILNDHNINEKNEDYEYYKYMEHTYSTLKSILPQFKDYKYIIELLPDDIKDDFLIDNIYKKISNLEVIYDNKKINDYYSMVTEYENLIMLTEEIKEDEKLLNNFSGMSDLKLLKANIKSLEDDIASLREKINNLRENNIKIKEEISDTNKSIEVYTDIRDTLSKFDETKLLYERYLKEVDLYKSTKEEIKVTELNIDNMKIHINNKKTLLQEKIINLSQYESLHEEIEQMNKVYDEMTFVKDSLSSRQGIPLYFISNYLKNTEDITNELLSIAYNGNIYIDSFDITPTEFSIPFYNNGIRLSDVKYASQGELSFLSIALSFALSSQALSKYNIMLLDEIDGPLDTKNREKFIQILENQINRIEAEQSFLITHNSMFSSYPVDIIDFSFKNDKEQYPLANFINIIK